MHETSTGQWSNCMIHMLVLCGTCRVQAGLCCKSCCHGAHGSLQSHKHGTRSFRQQAMQVTLPTGIAAMTVSNARCTSSVVDCAWCQPPDSPTTKSSTCTSKLKPKKRHISCMHIQTSKSCGVQTNRAEVLWSLTLIDFL